MNASRHLERLALACHRRGDTWSQFWEAHGAEVCRAEPHNRARFQRLIRKLLALVVSGDDCGMDGLDALDADDAQAEQPGPHDTETAATLQLVFQPMVCNCAEPCVVCRCGEQGSPPVKRYYQPTIPPVELWEQTAYRIDTIL